MFACAGVYFEAQSSFAVTFRVKVENVAATEINFSKLFEEQRCGSLLIQVTAYRACGQSNCSVCSILTGTQNRTFLHVFTPGSA